MTRIWIEDKDGIIHEIAPNMASIVYDEKTDLFRCSYCGNVIISEQYLVDCDFKCEGCDRQFKDAEDNYNVQTIMMSFNPHARPTKRLLGIK